MPYLYVPSLRAPVTILTGLVAYWRLDEASSTRVDQIGANDLTDNNTVTSAAGNLGDAAVFVGANSEYLSRADTADVSIGTLASFTKTLWVNFTSLAGTQILSGKGNAGSVVLEEWQLAHYSAQLHFNIGDSSTTQELVSSVTLSTGLWYFLALSLDIGANEMRLRVNATTDTQSASGQGSYNSANELTLGTWPATHGGYFSGMMQHVGLWKGRTLSTDELDDLYNGGAGFDPTV